ncbi:MAG: caspase family protein [Reichenbachiella sp.]
MKGQIYTLKDFLFKIIAASLFLITVSLYATAQDGIFIQTKTGQRFWEKEESTSGRWSKEQLDKQSFQNTYASLSEDNRYLALAYFQRYPIVKKEKYLQFRREIMTVIIDLKNDRVVKQGKDCRYQFVGEKLFRYDYKSEEDKKFATVQGVISGIHLIDQKTFESLKILELEPGILNVLHSKDEDVIIESQNMRFGPGTTFHYKVGTDSDLEKIQSFKLSPASISSDGNTIVGATLSGKSTKIVAYDLELGQSMFKAKSLGSRQWSPKMSMNGIIYYSYLIPNAQGNYKLGVAITDSKTGATESIEARAKFVELNKDESELIVIESDRGIIKVYDATTMNLISQTQETNVVGAGLGALFFGQHKPFQVDNGMLFIPYANGIISLFDTEKRKVVANIFFDKEDWAVIAKDGRMNGTQGALDKLEWQEIKNANLIKRTSLSSTFNQAYTPSLLYSLIQGQETPTVDLSSVVSQSPLVKIIKPQNEYVSDTKEITVEIQATSQGDPIKEILLYINGKLVGGNERGFKSSSEMKSFDINLTTGKNVITAKSLSYKGFESEPDQITINYAGQQAISKMHILAVGIDQYYNPRYNLNYATADARAFTKQLESNGSGIFEKVTLNYIENANATKENIKKAIDHTASVAEEQDVFVFYYAGHGVMSEGSDLYPSDFYLALHDVTQLYGKNELLDNKGISALELRNSFSNVKAQKQLIILDACQSGGAVETFARRGAAEEKAMLQLARSAGVVLIASTGSEQFASEFDELGHGLFTYSILEGLSGKADGGMNDKKITVKELESWVNDQIPDLSQKYKGTIQFPQSWARGQDFPLVIVE